MSAAESHEAARARKLADADHLERLARDEWPAEAAVSRAWAAILRAEAQGVPPGDVRMVALRAEHARACQAETRWRES